MPTTPVQGNDPNAPLKVDVLGTYIQSGLPFNDIFQSVKPGDNVVLRPKAYYQQTYGSKFENPKELDELWDLANEANDQYHRGQLYSKYKSVESVAQLWGETLRPVSPEFVPNPKVTPGITGAVKPLFTPSQVASGTNKVRDYNEDGTYTEKELTNFDRTVGNILNPLLVDYDSNGNPFLRHEKPGEYAVGLEQLSVWGPQELYGKSILESIPGFLSGMTVEMGSALATVAGAADYGLHRLYGDSKKEASEYARTFSHVANMLNSMAYKPSVESQNEGWFESWGGTAYKIGQGIGMLMPQKFVAKAMLGTVKMGTKELAKEAGKELSEMTPELLNATAKEYAARTGKALIGKEGANFIFRKGSPGMAMGMAAGVGSVQALSDVYSSAIENGIDKDDATLLTVTASPFIYATERFIGAKWVSGLLGEGGYANFKKAVDASIKSKLAEGVNMSSDKGRIEMLKGIFSDVGKKVGPFLELIKDAPITRGMVREGTQEAMEESLYMTMEATYD